MISMKKLCGINKQDLMKWVDGELVGPKAPVIGEHLKECASCQNEAEAYRRLNVFLRTSQKNIEVSHGFETSFWAKVSERQRAPWLERLLNGLEALVPVPNLRQAVAFTVLAFFIGNMGGVVSSIGQETTVLGSPASMRHLSGLQEYKGIAPYSLAGAYLSVTKKEQTK